MTETSALAAALAGIVGGDQVVTDPEVMAAYETDWTGRFRGRAALVARPADTAELARVVAACTAAGVPVVPQGGNTGLVAGGIPRRGGVVVSTRRMSHIEAAEAGAAATVSAGATLARLQRHARDRGKEFGVDLAARDSATVGGMIATNAGGIHVVRWGRMRDQVLGLEVVLADGRVVDRLEAPPGKAIHDLVGLMAGSEGTLGIVSRARVRLVDPPRQRAVALLAFDDLEAAAGALPALTATPQLSAVEYFGSEALDLVHAHRRLSSPLAGGGRAHLLVEVAGEGDPGAELFTALEQVAALRDSAVAIEPTGRRALWQLREAITESIAAAGIPHKYDVWLPPARAARFETEVRTVTERRGARLVLFGHLAEGSLHANVLGPAPEDDTIDEEVFGIVLRLGGEIGSEHGIGSAKVRWQHLALDPVELGVMRAVKRAFDPAGLLNPGVLIPADDPD